MQHHLKNFYTKLVKKKIGKMSQLILQFMAKINLGVFYAELEDNTKALEWLKKALGEAKKIKDVEMIKDIQESIREIESNN